MLKVEGVLKLRPSLRCLPLTYIPRLEALLYTTCPIIGKHDIHKTRSTKRTAPLSDEDRATATGNSTHNSVNFGHVVLEISEQSDRQTDMVTAILDTPPGTK